MSVGAKDVPQGNRVHSKGSSVTLRGFLRSLLLLTIAAPAHAQEAEYEAAEGEQAAVSVAELKGGYLLCLYASHFAQIAQLDEGSKDRGDLTKLAIDGGLCREAEPGTEVEVHEGAAEVLAPGIVTSDSVVMVVLPEAKTVAGQTEAWWISRAAVEVKQ